MLAFPSFDAGAQPNLPFCHLTLPLYLSWLIKSGFVSVGYTPQTTDICVCRRHVDNVGPNVGDILLSRPFFADKVVSGNRIPDTLSYVFVGISTDEVI